MTASPDIPSHVMSILSDAISHYPETTEVILFGSRAIGKAWEYSDIDLATRGITDYHRIRRLTLDLEDSDIPQKYDLHAYEDIHYAHLRQHIDNYGITIYARDGLC